MLKPGQIIGESGLPEWTPEGLRAHLQAQAAANAAAASPEPPAADPQPEPEPEPQPSPAGVAAAEAWFDGLGAATSDEDMAEE